MVADMMLIHALTEAAETTSPPDALEIAALIIQALAVLVALGASILALVISGRDRRALIAIARRDREHERLRTELDYAVRLSTNRNMGGSTDAGERKRLGSEALALASVVGERWVPRQYDRAMDYKTSEELEEILHGPETPDSPQWVKDKIEAGLAVQRILAELYRDDKKRATRSKPSARSSFWLRVVGTVLTVISTTIALIALFVAIDSSK